MVRRLLVISALWFGLLVATAPAFACGMQSVHGDCCPPGTQSPCKEDRNPADPTAIALICCAPAAPVQGAAITIQKSTGQQPHSTGGADPFFVVPRVAAHDGAPPRRSRIPIARGSAINGSLTYLHTSRLRL